MRHTAIVLCKDPDLFLVDPDSVCEPDIIPHPFHFLHISNGTVPKALETELFFILRLSKMSVQVNAVYARHFGRLLHQVPGHAEGRARCQNDLHECARVRVMIFLNQTLGIFQDGLFAVHNGIGRKSRESAARSISSTE